MRRRWSERRCGGRSCNVTALHEPTHPRPLPGGEQASVRVLSVPLLGGVRGGFMVPMHAQKRKEACHEPCSSGPETAQTEKVRADSRRLLRTRGGSLSQARILISFRFSDQHSAQGHWYL